MRSNFEWDIDPLRPQPSNQNGIPELWYEASTPNSLTMPPCTCTYTCIMATLFLLPLICLGVRPSGPAGRPNDDTTRLPLSAVCVTPQMFYLVVGPSCHLIFLLPCSSSLPKPPEPASSLPCSSRPRLSLSLSCVCRAMAATATSRARPCWSPMFPKP